MYENENQQWLDNLKEGDEVAIQCYKFRSSTYWITTISKITPTRIC